MRTRTNAVSTVLERGLVLGALTGVLIAELYLVVSIIPELGGGPDPWYGDLLWVLFVSPLATTIGCAFGSLNALLALTLVHLLGPLRRHLPLASLVSGSTAAALPFWLTAHNDTSLLGFAGRSGVVLSLAAFAAGASLIWPILTGRPWLPPGLTGRPPLVGGPTAEAVERP